jgi:hypothetical protein
MSYLSLKQNMGFYNMRLITQEDYPEYIENKLEVYTKIHKENENDSGSIYISTLYEIYKKKYNMLVEQDDITEHMIFKKKYNFPVHRLILSTSNLERVQTLPNDLLAFSIYGSSEFINFPVSVIPKKIVSMIFLHCAFPFNGNDLSKLKNLKVLSSTNVSMVKFPKLPKTIEYISFINSGLAFNFPTSLNDFKISNFPNLKYFDLTNSGIKKKDIPQEWKDAKKAKKIFIKY